MRLGNDRHCKLIHILDETGARPDLSRVRTCPVEPELYALHQLEIAVSHTCQCKTLSGKAVLQIRLVPVGSVILGLKPSAIKDVYFEPSG